MGARTGRSLLPEPAYDGRPCPRYLVVAGESGKVALRGEVVTDVARTRELDAPGAPGRHRSSGPTSTPTLSTTVWDPQDSAFDTHAVAVLDAKLSALLAEVSSQRRELERSGDDLGLTRKDVPVAVPYDWPATPGSPLHWVRAAEGYLHIAANGGVCRDAFPAVPRAESPPPKGRFCCTHQPPHCEPI